jgi:hypothetical protein
MRIILINFLKLLKNIEILMRFILMFTTFVCKYVHNQSITNVKPELNFTNDQR